MIDVYAAIGTFPDTAQLARDLAAAVMAVEGIPDIPMFRKNTAAFVHDLPAAALANVDGDSAYVRVQVLTNAGALDREKQIAVVRALTQLVAAAAGAPSLAERTWAKSFGKKITGACITHGHSDHWLGLARLLRHFPKSVGAADLPEDLAASQRYLRDFTALAKKGGTVEDLVHGMLTLHGERDQPHTLWISARAEVARRA